MNHHCYSWLVMLNIFLAPGMMRDFESATSSAIELLESEITQDHATFKKAFNNYLASVSGSMSQQHHAQLKNYFTQTITLEQNDIEKKAIKYEEWKKNAKHRWHGTDINMSYVTRGLALCTASMGCGAISLMTIASLIMDHPTIRTGDALILTSSGLAGMYTMGYGIPNILKGLWYSHFLQPQKEQLENLKTNYQLVFGSQFCDLHKKIE